MNRPVDAGQLLGEEPERCEMSEKHEELRSELSSELDKIRPEVTDEARWRAWVDAIADEWQNVNNQRIPPKVEP